MKSIYIIEKRLLIIIGLALMLISCKKFLDEKPVQGDIVPKTLNDLQSLLDNRGEMNEQNLNLEIFSDNYFVKDNDWNQYNSIVPNEAQAYIWGNTALLNGGFWVYSHAIYYSNVVIDQLSSVKKSNEADLNLVRGSALFYRSLAFYELAQLFCKPYSSSNLNDLGIVLRTTSNPNTRSTRTTIEETYNRIINDLKEAADILPVSTIIATRPSKVAAYAALARCYLAMRDYSNALKYADMALALKNGLLDFNELISNPELKNERFNREIIYYANAVYSGLVQGYSYGKIVNNLYESYDDSDLRKKIFFANAFPPNQDAHMFVGGYCGGTEFDNTKTFIGLTTSELYLIRAECYARTENIEGAMRDLNTLMIKRWDKNAVFSPANATSASDALSKVLVERRKELVYRGQRWSDIRRLNLEGANISITRKLNGVNYTLAPNDLRSVLLIPQDEINKSGIQQNPR